MNLCVCVCVWVCVCVQGFSRVGGQGQGLPGGVLEPVGLLHCSG